MNTIAVGAVSAGLLLTKAVDKATPQGGGCCDLHAHLPK